MRDATLSIHVDGREVERTTVRLGKADARRDVGFVITPRERGSMVVEARVAPFAGEQVLENNRRYAFVKVDETELRVLYVEGVLRRDYREIRRALAGTAGHSLDVTRAFIRGTPVGPDRWEQYDVFVLGEVGDGAISPLALTAIRTAVAERGRGLVVVAGVRALRGAVLRELVPLSVTAEEPASPSKVRIASIGGEHPALRVASRADDGRAVVAGLGEVGDRPSRATLMPGAEALLVADDGAPVLVVGRVGAGRAAVLATGTSYVWSADTNAPQGAYRRLLQGLVAWAAGRESSRAILSVELARHRLYRGDTVSIRARVNDARALEAGLARRDLESLRLQARVIGPLAADGSGGDPRTFGLEPRAGEHAGSLEASAGGRYRVVVEPVLPDARVVPAETLFIVARDEREFERLEADPVTLARVSKATGGIHARPERASRVFGKLLDDPSQTVARARRRESLWDRWWLAALLVFLLSTEWWLRRR